MKLQFNLTYLTTFGEELMLNIIADGSDNVAAQYKMSTCDGINWTCTISRQQTVGSFIDYYYSVMNYGREQRHEWLVEPHKLELSSMCGVNYTVHDHWIDLPEDAYMYSSAFTDCVSAHQRTTSDILDYERTLRLKVRAPQLRRGERLAIMGDSKCLGNWTALEAKPMTEHEPNEWVISLDLSLFDRPMFEFKFVALDEEADVTPLWEDGSNRTLLLPEMEAGDVVVYELTQACFQIAPWKGAGTVIPVFSLRSEDSFGVGDFGDLSMMTDWVADTHQRVLQILPINDTGITHTWTDSYPYNSISIYALHPQYIDLRQLPDLKDGERRKYYDDIRKELNDLPQIDYERVNNAKLAYLHELFAQEGDDTMSGDAYKQFFEQNESWLVPYAAFCHYRDVYGTASFSHWHEHRSFDDATREEIADTTTEIHKEVAFWCYVQYNLDRQMRRVHDHARCRGVILKGDIPIGISRDGVEAWMEPKYFNLDGQAGAPPDAFSVNGQNWGFPTYNWDAMLSDGCSWWVRRFRKMAAYFDAYRIDHVLGFFRIWEIPINAVHGLLGQFSPSLGMTREEIEAYGLHFQEERFLQPFITDWVIERIFKERSEEVKERFLDRKGDMYCMKQEYDTQRKVETAFSNTTEEKELWLRDGLYALISDVLFVRDHKNPNKFHPRIGVQTDFIYESLYDCDKVVFNKLYNDYFYHRNNQYWYTEAMRKLPILTQATRMLVCAEDLGMVPECVPWVMNQLRILSLEIQSMPKDDNTRFGHLSQNPYRSVCTISTHDMPTLRQWWDEDADRTQDYFNNMLYKQGTAPHPLPGWLAKEIVARHLVCPSMLCLLSLQDWLATDETLRLADEDTERINIPADPRHYWRYRMHLTIEELRANKTFNDKITTLISQSGRA